MNYKKIYENYYNIKILKAWDIHHIDGNRENNNIKNLISIPREFHKALHNWVGLIPENYISNLLNWYMNQNKKFSPKALGYYLAVKFKRMNTDKKLEISCKNYLKQNKFKQAINFTLTNQESTFGNNIYKS